VKILFRQHPKRRNFIWSRNRILTGCEYFLWYIIL